MIQEIFFAATFLNLPHLPFTLNAPFTNFAHILATPDSGPLPIFHAHPLPHKRSSHPRSLPPVPAPHHSTKLTFPSEFTQILPSLSRRLTTALLFPYGTISFPSLRVSYGNGRRNGGVKRRGRL